MNSIELSISLPVASVRDVDVVQEALWNGKLVRFLEYGINFRFDLECMMEAVENVLSSQGVVATKPEVNSQRKKAEEQEKAQKLTFISKGPSKPVAVAVKEEVPKKGGILGGGRMRRS